MPREEVRAAAVIGQRGNRGHDIAVAHEIAESRFHAMNGDDHACGHPILPLQRLVEGGIARLAAFALRDNRIRATHLHEFLKRVAKAFLIAVGCDGAGRVGGAGQCRKPAFANPGPRRDLCEIPFPCLVSGGGIAALRGQHRGGAAKPHNESNE